MSPLLRALQWLSHSRVKPKPLPLTSVPAPFLLCFLTHSRTYPYPQGLCPPGSLCQILFLWVSTWSLSVCLSVSLSLSLSLCLSTRLQEPLCWIFVLLFLDVGAGGHTMLPALILNSWIQVTQPSSQDSRCLPPDSASTTLKFPPANSWAPCLLSFPQNNCQ